MSRFLKNVKYPEGGKIGIISTVCRVASIDVRVPRDMIDKYDLLGRFKVLRAVLTCYRRFLSYKICL
jgi:hypothetical protein